MPFVAVVFGGGRNEGCRCPKAVFVLNPLWELKPIVSTIKCHRLWNFLQSPCWIVFHLSCVVFLCEARGWVRMAKIQKINNLSFPFPIVSPIRRNIPQHFISLPILSKHIIIWRHFQFPNESRKTERKEILTFIIMLSTILDIFSFRKFS